VSPRVFTVLQIFHITETTPRNGSVPNSDHACICPYLSAPRTIVSIPIALNSLNDPEFDKFKGRAVEGRYVSVERILELDTGKTEWRMATSSNPGGLIPSFLAESTTPNKIAEVCPSYLTCC
jgi:hypothetical protein